MLGATFLAGRPNPPFLRPKKIKLVVQNDPSPRKTVFSSNDSGMLRKGKGHATQQFRCTQHFVLYEISAFKGSVRVLVSFVRGKMASGAPGECQM